MSDKERIDQLEQLVRSFVLETLDYARLNKLGDGERQHNVRWARRLGITAKPQEDDLALARSMDDPNYQELVEEPKEE